jgi:hypothetical protein
MLGDGHRKYLARSHANPAYGLCPSAGFERRNARHRPSNDRIECPYSRLREVGA